jgi:spoIIIJ-associated protein
MDQEITSIESKAANVEAAITEGLARLGVAPDRVRIEVLDEGSRGVLGFGARDAVVRLTLLAPPPAEPEAIVVQEEPIRPTEPEKPAEPEEPKEIELRPTGEPSPADVIACEVLDELLTLMGIRAVVSVRQDEDTLDEDAPPFVLDILGHDLGILIGRRGQTLHDLQYITRLIVSREVGKWVNLVVDVEKYKMRRANTLQQLANRLAERVVLTQQPIALEPMPPHERRIIHVTLRDHPIVATESVGKGDRRKVTIIPKI